MMWTYNYTNELYHYGVKGMKWGVRNSKEVRAVNKAYKKELKPIRRELTKNSFINGFKADLSEKVWGKTYGSYKRVSGIIDNNKLYNQKKRELQEKYEPEFQKAKKAAEDRLSSPAEVQKRANRVNTGKKVAAGLLATAGAATAAAFAVDMIKNPGTWEAIKVLTMVALTPMDKLKG